MDTQEIISDLLLIVVGKFDEKFVSFIGNFWKNFILYFTDAVFDRPALANCFFEGSQSIFFQIILQVGLYFFQHLILQLVRNKVFISLGGCGTCSHSHKTRLGGHVVRCRWWSSLCNCLGSTDAVNAKYSVLIS